MHGRQGGESKFRYCRYFYFEFNFFFSSFLSSILGQVVLLIVTIGAHIGPVKDTALIHDIPHT